MSLPRRWLSDGLLLVALLAAGCALLAQYIGVLDGLEQRSVATRFHVRGASVPQDVAVVGIDAATFSRIGRRWPFPRSLHAQAIDALHAAGARAIVYDVQFTEATTPREDNALYGAIDRAGGAVLATSEVDGKGRTNVLGGDENLRAVHSRAAAANLPDGTAGVLDHFPRAIGGLRSLAVVGAERAGGPELPDAAFGADGAWIDFRGPPGTIPTVSFSDLIYGKVDPSLLRGRVVVIGATAPSLQDVHTTPTSAKPMAGAEIQASAIWTALHGAPLRDAPAALDIALVLLLAVVVPLLRLRVRVLTAAAGGPVVGLAFLAVAQLAFAAGTIVWVAAPLLALTLGTMMMVVVSHGLESAARKRVADDNDVLEHLVAERTRELRETQLEILQRLSRAAEWRDEDTGHHVARMGELSHRLALAIGVPPAEADLLGNAAVAHDIGKIAIPDRILRKPTSLTDAEQVEMQRHALIGASMLDGSRSPVMQLAEEIARTHHERWDGAGYPQGLQGKEIPLAGRICGLCDVFDALASKRPYKRAWPLERVLAEIRGLSGRHFDPELVDALLLIAPMLHAELYDQRPATRSAPQREHTLAPPA